MFDCPYCEKYFLNSYTEFVLLHSVSIASCPITVEWRENKDGYK